MSTRSPKESKELEALDDMIAEITVDAYGDDEQLWAFRQAFDHRAQDAIRHYEAGLRIGELSLGNDFNGVLAWGLIDNRPFLRCMHGYGLCLWCLGCFDEAERVFDRMLWLNPSDNQGLWFLIDEVKAKTAREDCENEFNLNIPRYVDTFEPEEEIDIAGVQQEIEQIEAELAETQKKMNNYLKELGF